MTSAFLPTVSDLKTQAKRLRVRLAADGDFISHGEALEILASQLGYRDWNTLSASARSHADPLRFVVGQPVSGAYLGHRFTGRVHGFHKVAGGCRLTVVFDEPIDVVKSKDFSAFRTRVTSVIGPSRRSAQKLSNGEPQFRLDE